MKDETAGVAMEEFLMIKYTSKTKDVIDQFLVIRVNYKETVILITIQKRFFAKHIVLIFSLVRTAFLPNISNLKNRKHLKNEKLMPRILEFGKSFACQKMRRKK